MFEIVRDGVIWGLIFVLGFPDCALELLHSGVVGGLFSLLFVVVLGLGFARCGGLFSYRFDVFVDTLW